LQDIKLRTFIFFVLILFLSFIASKIFSLNIAITFLILALIIYLISHIFWINELSKWLDNPKSNEIPDGRGIWQDIFSKIYKNYRFENKSKKDLATAMEKFLKYIKTIDLKTSRKKTLLPQWKNLLRQQMHS